MGLSLTTAYLRDQGRATPAHQHVNQAWLEQAPVLSLVPAPFRLDYSALDGPDVLTDDICAHDNTVRRFVLPQ